MLSAQTYGNGKSTCYMKRYVKIKRLLGIPALDET